MNDDHARRTLRVELGPRSYDIVVGPGVLAAAADFLAPLLRRPRVVVVSDANVAPLYLDTLRASLDGAGIAHDSVILPAGEATKSFSSFESLLERLLELKAERSTTLVALGGGVIGDITGFAAAVLLRGVDFVQIPTTLLAQVDSSVGGKTGINARHGKNLIGAFHQPRLVLADTGVLDSLPPRELRAGYAEVVKYGVIGDREFFSWLEHEGASVLAGDPAARRHAVLTSCTSKAAIVAADERESGTRALLNLGHTFGHALEAQTGYGGDLLHGEAVAIGMVMALDLSVRLGLCPAEDLERLHRHCAATGLPADLSGLDTTGWTPATLLGHMAQDKKVDRGRITFVLARGIGKAFLSDDVVEVELRAVLADAIASGRRG